MNKESWIPLTDYSSKYRVSVSTLRRRIKAEDIRYRFQDGKYFLLDTPMGAHPREHRPSQTSDASSMGTQQEASSKKDSADAFLTKGQNVFNNSDSRMSDEPILTAANKLLNELKKAYTLVLQEKEEQILHLKEEVSDLKTLVRVLENENERLNPSRRPSL
jgi:hypothetical protein